MIPERTWDPLDLLANVVSVLLAAGLWGTLTTRATPVECPASGGWPEIECLPDTGNH